MMIVVVDVDAIAIPFPIAAAVEVVGSHNPVRVIVEHDATGAVVDARGNEDVSHMSIAAVRIGAAGADAIMIVIPIAMVIAVAMLVPAFVLAVIVAVVITGFVFFPALLLFVVLTILAIIPVALWCRKRPPSRH